MKYEKKLIIWTLVVSLMLTLCVYIVSFIQGGVYLEPDQGASWYYWKLPNPTVITRMSAWIGYGLHQMIIWYVLYKKKKEGGPISEKMTAYNRLLVGLNIAFVLLHIIQSGIWYDGLAQDVSVWSSQYSVIVMLVLVLIMENGRRGMFFGRKAKLPQASVKAVYKYHGIYIAWAIIFTFWYHPIVGTPGHLFGFLYMFILMAQLSFAGMKIHRNKLWTLAIEVIVLFHGTTVAILQGNGMWSMFFFGFAAMFVVTQMYGTLMTVKMKGGVTVAYILFALFVYSGVVFNQRITMIHQVTWIPIVLYGLVFIIAYLLYIPHHLGALMSKQKNTK